ncbi:MAG: hypothetical protein M1482_08865 [Chloroflexi bacterium]|nr:hypothetical protein [Chloroflexota bacterium]
MLYNSQTESDFDAARFKAFLREIAAAVQHRPNELLSYDAVKQSVGVMGESYRGMQTVPVAQIVGSATLRYNDFDGAFLPRQRRTKSRWRNVDRAYYQNVDLPPVELYKIGDVYFVRDGHHRVSVARERGQEFIDAQVIEVQTRVPLSPDITAADLELVGEYSHFIEHTHIDAVRPDHDIRFSEPGGYTRLIEHIAVHRYFMGLEQKRRIHRAEAVASWYDNLYLPTVRAIRDHRILRDFPGRTEADLYLWIMDHFFYLSQQAKEVALEDAAVDFARHYSNRLDKRLLRTMRQAVTELLNTDDFAPVEGTMASEPRHGNGG